MRMLAALALPMMLLAGCATGRSDACPREVEYDRAFLTRLATETEALPPGSALSVAMPDYGRLRDQARACRAERAAKPAGW